MTDNEKGDSRVSNDSLDDSVDTNSSDVGYPVRVAHSNNESIQELQSDDRMVIDFNKSRTKTKRCGRCLLYLGLLIVILNFIGILAEFLSLFINFRKKSDQRLKDEEMFGEFHIFVLKFIEIGRKCIELA